MKTKTLPRVQSVTTEDLKKDLNYKRYDEVSLIDSMLHRVKRFVKILPALTTEETTSHERPTRHR